MIAENLLKIQQELPETVTLVAVSKTKPVEQLMQAYEAGQRIFGENKVQELCAKEELMPKDIEWHMIGHLQSNKVKYIAPFVALIHGVDSFKLLKEINKQGVKNKRRIPCLIQFHIAQEESKFGFDMDEVLSMLSTSEYTQLTQVEFRGVMGMATFTDNKEQLRTEFAYLKRCFDELHSSYFRDETFNTISMGMSGDYKIAIQEGSTMVRIGSSIFGGR